MTALPFLIHFGLLCLLTSAVVAATRHDSTGAVLRDAARLFAIFVGSVTALALVLLLFET